MKRLQFVPSFLALVAVAATAWAFSPEEIRERAVALEQSYESHQAAINACPSGSCAERQDILDEGAVLSTRWTDLRVDREGLDASCSCAAIDSALGRIESIADQTSAIILEWENEQ